MKKIIALSLIFSHCLLAQRQMENLNRGLIAMADGKGKALISWRLLGNDFDKIAFNLYRSNGREIEKLNKKPITETTNWQDDIDTNQTYSYTIKTIVKRKETDSQSITLAAHTKPYLNIALQTPKGYSPNDASVGDLDGDGEYEIIIHQTGRGRDNSQAGMTDPPILEAYKLNGKLLWRINLGRNIREGAHYTQFMVYDLDGDGKAELACKTADGTIDGQGKVIGDSSKNYVNTEGKILDGPEFFTIFDGLTGGILATTDYLPNRYPIDGWGAGRANDKNGNRSDRFLACVAYLDGQRPSVVMCRGYYARSTMAAWDWREGKLTLRWLFDSKKVSPAYEGQGNHNLTAADVDNDGKDEIVYGSMVIDDDGKGLYSTGLSHGDALHVSDFDPTHEGLEVFGIHEIKANEPNRYGIALYEAKTGTVLFQTLPSKDVGRGVAADIDPDHLGAEMWGSGSPLFTIKGENIGTAPRSANFVVWWDGDLSRELLDKNYIEKYKGERLLTVEGCSSANGTKATPALSGDILGDWREEVILKTNDNQNLRIYSTTIPTPHRLVTLMHDPQYRLSIAWQNVAYNQPPHTSFYLGTGMKKPKKVTIVLK